MHAAPFLRDLVVLLAASLPIVFVTQKFRLPSTVGFLIAGIIIGPAATALIASTEAVEGLAEVGVVLLLFTIGIEFSLTQLLSIRRYILGAGGIQLAATIAAVVGLAMLAGFGVSQAVVLGFIGALSSTAIVLKLLIDRGEIDSPHGQIALGMLLFQDLCVVPMMILLPALGRSEGIDLVAMARAGAVAAVAIGAVLVAARLVLPLVMRQVVRSRNRELFVSTVVLFCLGTAWGTAQLGLSLAIGAFVAGLAISESEYSHQVVAEALPFRDLFNSIFFMSMGMLLDLRFFLAHLTAIIVLTLATIALKALLGSAAAYALRPSWRIATVAGLLIAQIGEFSFILAAESARLHILAAEQFQLVLNVSVCTMIVSSLLITGAPEAILRLFARRDGAPAAPIAAKAAEHVLIIGYGLNGRNLARVLRETGLRYQILDLNAESVRNAAQAGEPIIFGDATRPIVLRHAGAAGAAVIVVAISDPVATRRIVSVAREVNARAAIIVRTRYVSEIEELYHLGADEVIPEEFETSVEIFSRVLRRMHTPGNIIAMQVALIRGERYAALRDVRLPRQRLDDLRAIMEASTTETFLLRPGTAAVGQTLRALNLREHTGATIIAIVRDGRPITNPPPDFPLQAGDILVMLGAHAELDAAMRVLAAPTQ